MRITGPDGREVTSQPKRFLIALLGICGVLFTLLMLPLVLVIFALSLPAHIILIMLGRKGFMEMDDGGSMKYKSPWWGPLPVLILILLVLI